MARPWTNTFIQETRFAQFPRGVTLETIQDMFRLT